ncbi:tail fiber assembly protein [Photorhabdus tasmaniensis]|nr:tail fiber assembly protein [Photorhabdus tasmaniensis]
MPQIQEWNQRKIKGCCSNGKKYVVLLNRIDVAAAPDITWPEKPMK